MAVRKIRHSWWVDFRWKRTRYRRRSPVNTRSGAATYELTLRERLVQGARVDEEPAAAALEIHNVRFAEFADEWFTTYVLTNNKPSEQSNRRMVLRAHLIPWFGHLPLDAITTQLIEQFKAYQLSKILARKTVNNHLAILARCLRCATQWGHLDHMPVIDEDGKHVDYRAAIEEALALGYESVMVDASRLALDDNIRVTREISELSHRKGAPCESELGAVLGHESGPLPPYEELFQSGRGFTDPAEAKRFVVETGVDWLSVAVGNIHGAISGAAKSAKKVEARLDIAHLDKIREVVLKDTRLNGLKDLDISQMEAKWLKTWFR